MMVGLIIGGDVRCECGVDFRLAILGSASEPCIKYFIPHLYASSAKHNSTAVLYLESLVIGVSKHQ
jgi:hypothetical protein